VVAELALDRAALSPPPVVEVLTAWSPGAKGGADLPR